MTMLFGITAIIGMTLLLCQFVLTLIGFGGSDFDGSDVDVSHDMGGSFHGGNHGGHNGHGHADHGPNWFFGVITFRTLTAALAFFGLAGLALQAAGVSVLTTFAGAFVAGLGAMYLLKWLMQSLAALRSDGTVRIDRAVGAVGTVYLTIPGHNKGLGKVTLNLQSRAVEVEARTAADGIPTGAKVKVVRVEGEIVDVIPANSAEQVSAP